MIQRAGGQSFNHNEDKKNEFKIASVKKKGKTGHLKALYLN